MRNEPGRLKRRLRKAALVAFAAPLVWLLFLATRIVLYAGESDPHPADAAIVLGAAVRGGLPTPVFAQRIRHAVELYRTRRVPVLVLTGGVGANDTLAESEAARLFCLANGVAERDILIETQSRSTYGNLWHARRLLTQHRLHRVLVVSDPLHMRRAVTMARDLGIDALPSPTPTSRYVGMRSRGVFLVREVYFYARYLVEQAFGWDSSGEAGPS